MKNTPGMKLVIDIQEKIFTLHQGKKMEDILFHKLRKGEIK